MSSQATTEEDRTSGVIPAAPWRVAEVSVMPGYRLAVTFVDGSKGVVDLSLLVEREDAGLFTALREPSFFARAYLELGVVTWPNGADLDPAWMHEEINDKGEWRIGTKRGRS